jgi:hypothetical protein
MGISGAEHITGDIEMGVPQRPRLEPGAGSSVVDLPVEPAENGLEPWIDRFPVERKTGLLVKAQPAGQLVEGGVEFLADAAFEMAREQR